MDTPRIDAVRSFSRLVTQRVGALDENYLARRRPLGQSRVLWEIGRDGIEVGVLRSRLGIDSAQLSRTLRILEQDGFLEVRPHPADSRVRSASLTAAGTDEWSELESGSQAAAAGILDPLTEGQQHRMIEAMATVERLLMVSMVEIDPRSPSDAAARACLRAYTAEIESRFGSSFESGGGDEHLTAPHGRFLVATMQGEPIGCGGVRFDVESTAEIKRLWTAPSARGLGLGRRLLGMLEDLAVEHGATRLRLDTNDTLTEAMALYRSAGYDEIARYNDNPHAEHWFEKLLT